MTREGGEKRILGDMFNDPIVMFLLLCVEGVVEPRGDHVFCNSEKITSVKGSRWKAFSSKPKMVDAKMCSEVPNEMWAYLSR